MSLSTPPPFFAGTVNEAIESVLRDQRYLVVFVTDETTESCTWEDEFLPDLRRYSCDKALVLRLLAGSPDAKNLAALFPMPKFPTVIIIHERDLKDYIPPGTSQKEFHSRAKKALGLESLSASSPTQPTQIMSTLTPSPDDNSGPAPSAPVTSTSAAAQLEAYRTANAERERLRKEAAAEKARCAREERQRATTTGLPSANTGAPRPAPGLPQPESSSHPRRTPVEQAHLDTVMRRKAQTEAERRRILAQIETDKADRRARAELQAMNREAARRDRDRDSNTQGQAQGHLARNAPVASRILGLHDDDSDGTSSAHTCALQVRLPDGSLIRARFGGRSTLAAHVRPWINEHMTPGAGGGKRVAPSRYRLTIILTPRPNVSFDEATERDKTLLELDMAPSATLVAVPLHDPSASFVSSFSSAAAASSSAASSLASVATGHSPHGLSAAVRERGAIIGLLLWLLSLVLLPFSWAWKLLGENLLQQGAQEEIGRDEAYDDYELGENVRRSREEKTLWNQQQWRQSGVPDGNASGVDNSAGGGRGNMRMRQTNDGNKEEKEKKREQYYNGNSTAFEARPDDE